MNGEAWTDAAIEALIRRLDGDDWRVRAADIHRDLPGWVLEGRITEERAERLTDAIQARQDRTTQAAERKVEFRTQRITAADGSKKNAKAGRIGCLVTPMVDEMRPAPPSPPAVVPKIRAGVRGPSRHTPEERHERIRYLRRQADLAKLPADLSAEYSRGELSVISNVLFGIHESAAGACELTLEALAARARVSKRCVQDALSIAKSLGHLLVERRGRKPSRITVLMPRIQKWLNGPDATLLMEKIEELLEAIKSPSHVADICHSETTEPTQSAQEGQGSVSGRVVAEHASRPSTGQKTNPGGIRAAWHATPDRANAVVAAAARSREREGELGREGDCPTSA
ncbi:hypothetical protein [Methylorubrum extorquens]|uniref:hypothetical protein n=1 Tax=Methylorubrum extorquens TaxID=408 RepID=UPI0012DB7A6B|nr:hypothetical protein [Methylorubrum extorquens]